MAIGVLRQSVTVRDKAAYLLAARGGGRERRSRRLGTPGTL